MDPNLPPDEDVIDETETFDTRIGVDAERCPLRIHSANPCDEMGGMSNPHLSAAARRTGRPAMMPSPQAGKATAPCCRNCRSRFHRMSRSDTVTGGGAFDTRRCHAAILDRGGAAIIPIRKNGRPGASDEQPEKHGSASASEVGSRQGCDASSLSVNASPQKTPTTKPPKPTSVLHS